MNQARPWEIWIDTGGTFTDCVAVDPEGGLRRCKLLSSGALRDRIEWVAGNELGLAGAACLPPHLLDGMELGAVGGGPRVVIAEHPGGTGAVRLAGPLPDGLAAGDAVELRSDEAAPLLAARLVTGTPAGAELPPLAMRLATTIGTNALLERRGARSVHVTTAGFEDLLAIGDQRRPELFKLRIERPHPLPELVIGVRERLAADGSVLEELDRGHLEALIGELRGRGFASASIALLHGHRNPVHELAVEAMLLAAGFSHVARSSALSPFQGLLRRSQTAAVDAYLGPVIGDYLRSVHEGLGARADLHVMTSAGGLVRAPGFHARDSLLSGPAGGVVGAATAGRAAGTTRVIAFDMGGTSTDVARCDGDFEYVFSHRVGGVELAAPALAIETVAAGGGSICRFAQGRLTVGPDSAGASPGPASYGAGGPLTVTDVNLLLGRLLPERLPIPIDLDAARARLAELRAELAAATGEEPALEDVLEGLLRIADERMAEAIRHISVRKGIDPADFHLVAFGGAGGQHACRVAEILGIREVVVPGDAGLLSALGLGHAALERFAGRELLEPLTAAAPRLDGCFAELEEEAVAALEAEGVPRSAVERPRRLVELRYHGQDASLELEPAPGSDLEAAFEEAYFKLFGYRPRARGIEVVSLRVVARSRGREPAAPQRLPGAAAPPRPAGRRRCFLGGGWREVPCWDAAELAPGAELAGPALIQQAHSAVVLPPGWRAEGLGDGGVRLGRGARVASAGEERPAAVELELMSHRFESIAGEMGEMLKRTAVSTNIKEREDFSCALLDADGRLVVNAPHIPVHLGAMGLCVRGLLAWHEPAAGEVVVTNHPAYGGSHLPDLTLVAPVHVGAERLGFVACRAHHAEIGGSRPGSVPPDARSLLEEGAVLPPTLLVAAGEPRWAEVERLLTAGPYPTRALADNLADLRAMLAAVLRGREALARLAAAVGTAHVAAHMDALRGLAAREAEAALARLPDGVHSGRQLLDDGSPLAATVTLTGRRAVIDFAGSSGVHPGNLNATPAIVHSVVMYVMRVLVERGLPLNEGLLEPVEIRIPRGILNPGFDADPGRCPAVVGGNVETSQRLVDTLLEALKVAACSQGTMNNLSFGDERFGYYETVAGGAGAGEGFTGASGVHTHMTNTRITDPEVLEHRYPVRLRRFALRRGSGGAGRWRGGDGLLRELEFLAPMSLSILSQHRASAPYGMAGGEPGAAGRQEIVRADGSRCPLAGTDGCEVGRGDRFVLETPGGGGYGDPEEV